MNKADQLATKVNEAEKASAAFKNMYSISEVDLKNSPTNRLLETPRRRMNVSVFEGSRETEELFGRPTIIPGAV